jgi:ubiquinone/menaquinone biosynthesis C-methylase UbiE
MTTPRPSDVSRSYGRIADRYEQARGGADRARRLADAVLPWLEDMSLICDVGVGTAIIAGLVEGSGIGVVGVDISEEMLRLAKRRLPGQVAQAEGSALPLRSGSVDAVVFVWVLHHVGDLPATLCEAARVTRPGGRVIAVSGFADPVDDDIDPILCSLDAELRPDRWSHNQTVAAAANHAGLRHEHTDTAVVEFTTSPEGMARSIEERMFSTLWDLDEPTWQAVVAPKVTALRHLEKPEQARVRTVHHPLWVWQRP